MEQLRESEALARRLTRLYAMSSGINEAIVRLRDEASLYTAACELAVRHGFARLAWVGLLDGEGRLRPVARAGDDTGYIDLIVLDLNDTRMNRGPSGQAFTSGTAGISNDIASDPDFFWKEEALQRGLRACAAFPIAPGGVPRGAFALYTDQPGSFGDEEVRVLLALAADISFAIESSATTRERERLQQHLEASEARLRAVVEHTPNVAIQWYDEQARVLFANRASYRLFGWTPGQEVGRTLDELNFPPHEAARFAELVAAVRRTGEPAGPVEFRFTHPEGGEGVLLSTVFEIPLPGEGFRCACMDVDVTAHRRLEAQLAQSERLQSLGRLAGGIAHDFNNLIGAIRGYADLAVMQMADAAAVQQHVADIRRSADRAADLVRRILVFSRGERANVQTIDAGPIAREAVAMLRATLGEGIDARANIACDLRPILGDGTQVHQVLMNLVTNAAHAIGEGPGTIAVTCDNLTLEALSAPGVSLPAGDYVRISVADNGCGMDASTLARVFEPFFSTKAAALGTGLGLSVVHGIMKSHRGAVTVSSEPGAGTRFDLFFPAAPLPAGATNHP
ncbi:MAG: ATP-binding protein [Vicinamibacterales bacterium]